MRIARIIHFVPALAGMLSLTGCAATMTTAVDNSPSGRLSHYEDPGSVGHNSGVGIESQDIQQSTDLMVRDILSVPVLANAAKTPRVIVDDAYFVNEGSSVLNKRLLTDRLRVGLNRGAAGRMLFLARENIAMVEQERELKRDGVVDAGTRTGRVMGADFRLTGRIATLDRVEPRTGITSRYHQITFEMVDLSTSVTVWSNMYEFRKAAIDDQVYR